MNLKQILYTLSGDDYTIIRQSDVAVQNRFMVIGIFVFAIFALCFVSSYFTFTMLFQNYYFGVPVALFFAWMITNIYLLLLYTLSKNSFPCITDKAATLVSVAIRVIFISFIAIIVSKPIESLIYDDELILELNKFKVDKIEKYKELTTDYFNAETENLKLIIQKQQELYQGDETSQVSNYTTLLEKKEKQKDDYINSMTILVNKSNYYIQGILILNSKYRKCWLYTLGTIIIFLIPVYLKNYLGENNSYYSMKRDVENRIVKDEYINFKTRYAGLFYDYLIKSINLPANHISKSEIQSLISNHNFAIQNIKYSELFSDAPFNTIKFIDEKEFLKEEDLLSDLYDA